MIAEIGWFSPTRMTGLFAYSCSLAACVWRWSVARRREMRRSAGSGVFSFLAGVQLALVLDIAFDLRWKLHAFWMDEATALGVYGERRGPQLVVLLLMSCLSIFGLVWIARRFGATRGVATAVTGTMFSVGLWCCEMLSYHYTDQVLFHMVGKVMVVSLLWLALATTTCIGAWMDSNSQHKSRF